MEQGFLQSLLENEWLELQEDWEYSKGKWLLLRDTSSWWIVATLDNPRVFDFEEPNSNTIGWTIRLIEHLCKMEDERIRLRTSLEKIKNVTKESLTTEVTLHTLDECYHTWLVVNDGLYCPICHARK